MDFLKKLFFLFSFLVCVSPTIGQTSDHFSTNDFSVELPSYCAQGVPVSAVIYHVGKSDSSLKDKYVNAIINGENIQLKFQENRAETQVQFDTNEPFSLKIDQFVYVEEKEPMPLWLSIIAPLIVILLALITREVITSLTAGILAGIAIMLYYTDSTSIFEAFPRFIDSYIIESIANPDHVAVIVFSTLIGGMVAVISRNGGMSAVVTVLSKKATNARRGQLVTWFLGLAIFFDDYANTLVVGNTMRPLTDKLKISREKLSYIVDSTAAPVAAVAFITTWIGAELGYIQGALDAINSNETLISQSAYGIFFSSLQFAFYPILCLVFMFIIIWSRKDFGPMWHAENRMKDISYETSINPSELEEYAPIENAPKRVFNAAIPVFTIVIVTIIGLLATGNFMDVFQESNMSFGMKLSKTIGAADSYKALLWSSLAGLFIAVLLSVFQKIMTLSEAVSTSIKGFKSMLDAVIILILAWSLASITEEMHTADYLAGLAQGSVSYWMIPGITFLIAALVAFSTGSSWGTMAIIYPIMLPLSWSLASEGGLDITHSLALFYNTTSCVLAGAVLGDHCSPISDTTILSSLATKCDHIQHVRTQLPYAVVVGVVALFLTILSSIFIIHGFLLMLIGTAILLAIVRLIGKRAET